MAQNRQWITGKELLERWGNLPPFYLLHALKEGLGVWHKNTGINIAIVPGRPLYVTTSEFVNSDLKQNITKEFIKKNDSDKVQTLLDGDEFVFQLYEVEGYEKEKGIGPEVATGEDPFLVSSDSSLAWQDITITFLST